MIRLTLLLDREVRLMLQFLNLAGNNGLLNKLKQLKGIQLSTFYHLDIICKKAALSNLGMFPMDICTQLQLSHCRTILQYNQWPILHHPFSGHSISQMGKLME